MLVAASTASSGAAPARRQMPTIAVPTVFSENDRTAFYKQWFCIQGNVAVTDHFLVVELVTVRINGVAQPPYSRTLVVTTGGTVQAHSSKNPLLMEAQKALAISGQAPPSAISNDQLRLKRVASLRRFHDSTAFCIDSRAHLHYGKFPLEPREPSACSCPRGSSSDVCLCETFTSEYLGLQELSTDQLAEMCIPAFNGDMRLPAATERQPRTPQLYSATARTEAHVDEALSSFDSRPKLLKKLPDGVSKVAFGRMCSAILDGYTEAGRDERDAKLRTLMAVPRLHCRMLRGSVASRHRTEHLRSQLAGAVCEQQIVLNRAATGVVRETALTPEEFDVLQAKGAFKHCIAGELGRGAARLVRTQTAAIPPEKQLAALKLLHPDGEPAKGVALLPTPFYNSASFTSDAIIKSVRRSLSGAAPGPDGWTFELLSDALASPEFARNFHAIVVDLCNGLVGELTARILSASTLVGIAKGVREEDGIRPLALGAVFMKVAATQACAAALPTLKSKFGGSQFGCTVPDGAACIVHRARNFIRSGIWPDGRPAAGSKRLIITLDLENAFNSPSRQAIWDAVCAIPELVGIFNMSYGSESELFVAGMSAVLLSKRGTKQGTVEGPVLFALAIQGIINAANLLPGVLVLAYLDDMSIFAEDPDVGNAVAEYISSACEALQLRIKVKKCETLRAFPSTVLPARSLISQFADVQTLKLLGASVSMSDYNESVHLVDREFPRHEAFFRRLRLGCSPQFFSMLRTCGIPKLSYAMRTHCPSVALNLAQQFDANVTDVLNVWSGVSKTTSRARIIKQLPVIRGGLGLTSMELVSPAAYLASRGSALGQGRAATQANLVEVLVDRVFTHSTKTDPELLRHLQIHSLRGSDSSLSCLSTKVDPDVFGAHLRNITMTDADPARQHVQPGQVGRMNCPFCNRTFALGGAWGQHVTSCVTGKGGMVTKRHNTVVHQLRRIMHAAGLSPDDKEPRHLAIYACPCGTGNLDESQWLAHKKVCSRATAPRDVSGPDIGYNVNHQAWAADFTVINLLTATHAHEDPAAALQLASRRKVDKYSVLCERAHTKMLPLPATANGHCGEELVRLLNDCARRSMSDPDQLRATVAASLAFGSAQARLVAEQHAGVRPSTVSIHRVALAQQLMEIRPLEMPGPEDGDPPDGPILPTPAPHEPEGPAQSEHIRGIIAAAFDPSFRSQIVEIVHGIFNEALGAAAAAAAAKKAESPTRARPETQTSTARAAELREDEQYRAAQLTGLHLDQAKAVANATVANMAGSLDDQRQAVIDGHAMMKATPQGALALLASATAEQLALAASVDAETAAVSQAADHVLRQGALVESEATSMIDALQREEAICARKMREQTAAYDKASRCLSQSQARCSVARDSGDVAVQHVLRQRAQSEARSAAVVSSIQQMRVTISDTARRADAASRQRSSHADDHYDAVEPFVHPASPEPADPRQASISYSASLSPAGDSQRSFERPSYNRSSLPSQNLSQAGLLCVGLSSGSPSSSPAARRPTYAGSAPSLQAAAAAARNSRASSSSSAGERRAAVSFAPGVEQIGSVVHKTPAARNPGYVDQMPSFSRYGPQPREPRTPSNVPAASPSWLGRAATALTERAASIGSTVSALASGGRVRSECDVALEAQRAHFAKS